MNCGYTRQRGERSRHPRFLRAALAAAMTATVLAGCASASTDEPEPGPLTMLLPAGTVADSMQPIVDEFSESTGIDVNAIVLPVNDMRSRQVLSLNQKSSELDVIMLDDSWVAEVRNHLLPLDMITESDLDGYLPSVVEAFKTDGTLWALPSYMSTRTIFYRTDILEEAGLEPPRTFDELRATAKALTTGPQYGFVFPLGNSETYVNSWATFAYNAGMEGLLNDSNTEAAFNDEGGLAALELLDGIFKDGSMPPDSIQYGMEQVATAMYEGQAAMGMLSTPFVERLSDPANTQFAGKFRMMPMPQAEGVTGDSYITAGFGFSLSKYGEHQDEALELLRFINEKFLHPGPDADASVITNPASEDAFASPALAEVFVDGQDELIEHMMTEATTRPHVSQWGEIVTVLGTEMQKVFLGQQSAKDALTKSEEQVNEALSKD